MDSATKWLKLPAQRSFNEKWHIWPTCLKWSERPRKIAEIFEFLTASRSGKGVMIMLSRSNEPTNLNLRYADRDHLQERYKEYRELKRKREMPLSERKAEQLQKLREIGKRK